MTNKSKIACKGCHNPILVSTANKYHGFSRQCLAQHQAKLSQGPAHEPSIEDIQFYLHKTKITFPKLYYYKEFVRLWALHGSAELAHKYYLSYLTKLESIVFDLTLTRQETALLYKPYAEVVA